MNFRATEFEFHHRVWIIAGIFCAAFLCYVLDPVNVSAALSNLFCDSGALFDPKKLNPCVRMFFILGAFLSALAALVRTWASAYLHSAVVHDINLHLDRLVADGPYRHLRNPLYLGNVLLSAGFGFMASRVGAIILVGGMTLFIYRLILREEAGLLESQSEAYRRYFDAVPRLVPSLKPEVASAGAQPDWIDGFTGEALIWACAAGMALYAAFVDIQLLWIAMGVGFICRFVKTLILKRLKVPRASNNSKTR